jgi:hypothetical protein
MSQVPVYETFATLSNISVDVPFLRIFGLIIIPVAAIKTFTASKALLISFAGILFPLLYLSVV